jgi:hypothetical protein
VANPMIQYRPVGSVQIVTPKQIVVMALRAPYLSLS